MFFQKNGLICLKSVKFGSNRAIPSDFQPYLLIIERMWCWKALPLPCKKILMVKVYG
jgi:hypothetical protein